MRAKDIVSALKSEGPIGSKMDNIYIIENELLQKYNQVN